MTDDKFHDECGVVGIFGADNAARLSYFALTALQHRGQESAGIAVCNTNIAVSNTNVASSEGAKISLCKDMGLVGDVFSTEHLQKLSGNISVGHVRYATAGGRTIENAQPFLNSFKNGSIALCHNGQLVNHAELRAQLEDGGSTFSSSSDSEVILKLIVRKYIENGGKLGSPNTGGKSAEENRKRFIDAVVQTAGLIKGSFALCIMTENMLIGVRDPNGIRPLCLGEISGGVAGVSPAQGVESNEVRPQGGTPP
ncbi:MAG: class II glutamine amidotransferase, partial [Treponema sp.]|nr:class II glutamine amidotransferase [Treponema sp.]